MTKTCFNCRWLGSEPEIGIFCQKDLDNGLYTNLYPQDAAKAIAAQCSEYSFLDDSDPDIPDLDVDPDIDLYADVLRLQGMGLLDKDGMPTDEFFNCLV